MEDYIYLATQNEDLKSEERILTIQLENVKKIREILLDKERQFCEDDRYHRALSSPRDALERRCLNLIDHLVHYKFVIECLATDLINLESNLIDDDEFLQRSLCFRQSEVSILRAIKKNQKRNEVFRDISHEEVSSRLNEIEIKWRLEHQERRNMMTKLLFDQHQIVLDKLSQNLAAQRKVLNLRYQTINSLIQLSFTQR